jgi:hypothetical protein
MNHVESAAQQEPGAKTSLDGLSLFVQGTLSLERPVQTVTPAEGQ